MLAATIGGTLWLLIGFLVVPPDLNYSHIEFRLASSSLAGPLILGSVLAAGTLITLMRARAAWQVIAAFNRPLLLLMALAGVSLIWSADPEATLRRLFRLYTFFIGALGFAIAGWHRTRFQELMRATLTTLVVGSLCMVVLAPDLAIPKESMSGNGWRGLATQKNALGAIAAAAIVFWLHGWLAREVRLPKFLAAMLACVVCLIGSQSATSTMSALFAVIFMLLLLRAPGPALRRHVPYLVGLAAAAILAYSLAVLDLIPGSGLLLSPIAALTGKDMTFTGRTEIWAIVKEQINLHPILGIGYGAYWTGPVPGTPSFEMLRRLYFYPTESHNGYLEIINDLGFVGGACLIAYLVAFLRRALWMMKFDRMQGGLYVTLLFQQFLGNMSEAHWLAIGSMQWLIMLLATAALARGTVQLRASRPGGAPAQAVRPPGRFGVR